MKTAAESFTGHAKLVTDFSECKNGEHYLLYSKQFKAINEIVIDSARDLIAGTNLIHYSYAKREHLQMALWLHEIQDGNSLLFKIC